MGEAVEQSHTAAELLDQIEAQLESMLTAPPIQFILSALQTPNPYIPSSLCIQRWVLYIPRRRSMRASGLRNRCMEPSLRSRNDNSHRNQYIVVVQWSLVPHSLPCHRPDRLHTASTPPLRPTLPRDNQIRHPVSPNPDPHPRTGLLSRPRWDTAL